MTDIPQAPGLSLRSVEEGDQLFLDALYRSTRTDLLGCGADPQMTAALITMQQRFQESGHRSAFPRARRQLIEQDGQPLGRMVIDCDPVHGMRVVDIALLPQARNRGHGTALLRSLQREAAQLQLPLRLSVMKENTGARRLYGALGFVLETAGEAYDELVWRAA